MLPFQAPRGVPMPRTQRRLLKFSPVRGSWPLAFFNRQWLETYSSSTLRFARRASP